MRRGGSASLPRWKPQHVGHGGQSRVIFCPAAPPLDETAQMIYGGSLHGERCSQRPQQTHTKLGYSQNVKALSQTNKFNHGLLSLQVVLILQDYSGLCSVLVSSLRPRRRPGIEACRRNTSGSQDGWRALRHKEEFNCSSDLSIH